ncbi:MAG: glycoside hydrolase family 105 protein [Vicinamibacterales bacterium]
MSLRLAHAVGLAAIALSAFPGVAAAQSTTEIESALQALAGGANQYAVEAIGLTPDGQRIMALEPALPPVANQRRVILVGGLDGTAEATRAVLDVLAWSSESGAVISSNRRRWQVAGVPCVLPGRCDVQGAARASAAAVAPFPPDKGFFDAPQDREARYLWRWVTMAGPDLVVEVRSGDRLAWTANALASRLVTGATPAAPDSLAGALGTGAPSGLAPVAALQVSGPTPAVVAALRQLLERRPPNDPSPLHRVFTTRRARRPLDLARMLAGQYPATPSMSYIPALSWSGALRVSALTGDPQYRDRALAQMQPFLSGARPAITEPHLLTSLAGHQALFDLAGRGGPPEARSRALTAADFILGQTDDEIVRFATSWTDDMFMATSVLARAAAATGEAKYADAAARLLTTYVGRLQREDRLFIHAQSGPHAWGRGNGFAAFGLMEALTHLPESWPARADVLAAFQRLMNGLRRYQAADGAWHQVVDEPGTYREFTVTAMTVAAMARGVRLGWLDRSYREVVDKGWRAVLSRVADDGSLVDVCTGTGAGQNANREYYLTRPALFGRDDRGGAMALTAALEVHALVNTAP